RFFVVATPCAAVGRLLYPNGVSVALSLPRRPGAVPVRRCGLCANARPAARRGGSPPIRAPQPPSRQGGRDPVATRWLAGRSDRRTTPVADRPRAGRPAPRPALAARTPAGR